MDSLLQAEKQASNEKRRKRGLLSLGVGASLLGTGFIIQYVLYSQGISFDAVMYTLTSLGVGLIFYAAIQFFS